MELIFSRAHIAKFLQGGFFFNKLYISLKLFLTEHCGVFPLLKVNVYPVISHFHVWRIPFSGDESQTGYIRQGMQM